MRNLALYARLSIIGVLVVLLSACAHPIAISPLEASTHARVETSHKKVAYVMTDSDRNTQVITAGGGGDKISYFPYRDLEKAIRDALQAVYSDVIVIGAPDDKAIIANNGVSLIFEPRISTSSSSDSIITWPPTRFNVELSCKATDISGNVVSEFKVVGSGVAEFSEFKSDFGLAGRRAASDMTEKLIQSISANPLLH